MKGTIFGIGLIFVLVAGAIFVSANVEKDEPVQEFVEEKATGDCGCGSCNGDCGGKCGVEGCGCSAKETCGAGTCGNNCGGSCVVKACGCSG